jgi:hypothetical protein
MSAAEQRPAHRLSRCPHRHGSHVTRAILQQSKPLRLYQLAALVCGFLERGDRAAVLRRRCVRCLRFGGFSGMPDLDI